MYDQQREVYVQSVLAHIRELEQQLAKQQEEKQDTAPDGEMCFYFNHFYTNSSCGRWYLMAMVAVKL